jgi:NAD(P)H-dependent flavin oxidoreductase YrpB (nitropropane dioxygenase family)
VDPWFERLGLRHPVLQAGMGGGVVRPELAAAVSRAGGLGTIGNLPPDSFARAIRSAKERSDGRPVAANLLMPFTRDGHVEACLAERPAVVSLFFGYAGSTVKRLRAAGIFVLHQVGTPAEAERALADGADGLILQGREAGGHLLGARRLAEALPDVVALASGRPVIAAGGIYDRASAERAARLGAAGVAAGTRFLLTDESGVHPTYRQRLLDAKSTLVTKLFGAAWPADHRVVPNAATARWCRDGHDGPSWITAVNTLLVPTRWVTSPAIGLALAKYQRADRPLFSPQPMTARSAPEDADVTPLYAGECVTEIRALRSAADVVEELAAGFAAGLTA